MGHVFITFSVTNLNDHNRVNEGTLDAARLRSQVLADVMMDTGATYLCLPEATVRRLGLIFAREVPVQTAAGRRRSRVFQPALVEYEDRASFATVMEVPDGTQPLMGVLVMEELGIEPDLQNRRVRKLPMDLNGTYISA